MQHPEGGLQRIATPPAPLVATRLAATAQWNEALRLCRIAKVPTCSHLPSEVTLLIASAFYQTLHNCTTVPKEFLCPTPAAGCNGPYPRSPFTLSTVNAPLPQEPLAWACLAAHALRAGQLSLATSCYAALDMPHKVHLLRCLGGEGQAPQGGAARQAVAVALLSGDASAAESALVRVCGGLVMIVWVLSVLVQKRKLSFGNSCQASRHA